MAERRARERVGYRGELRSLLLTERIAHADQRQRPDCRWRRSTPICNWRQRLGCPPESPRLELATTAADEAAADEVWQRLGLPRGGDVVVFNTGGAFGSAKNWPAEHFAGLARRIAADRNLSVLVNCGPKERDTAREIVALAGDRRVVSLADEARACRSGSRRPAFAARGCW